MRRNIQFLRQFQKCLAENIYIDFQDLGEIKQHELVLAWIQSA
jgi:hypothetical protein